MLLRNHKNINFSVLKMSGGEIKEKQKTKTKLQLNIGDSLNVSLQETFPDQC